MGSGADAVKAHGAGLGVGVAWRGKRRNLEWQCSWIELRTREIDRHIERYEARLRVMKTSEGGKSNAEEKGGEERVNDGTDGTFLRTKIDASSSSLAPVVLGHQMFAAIRRESHDTPSDAKKRKTSENDGHGIVSTTTAQLSGSKAAGSTKELVDHANPKSEKKCKVMEGIEPKETNSDSDISTTALYEQIDAAQKRVASLKERLNQTAPKLSQKTLDGKFKTPTPKTKGKNTERRRREALGKSSTIEQTMRSTSTTSSRPKVPRSMSNAPYTRQSPRRRCDKLVLSLRLLRYSRTMSLLTRTFLTKSSFSDTRNWRQTSASHAHRSCAGATAIKPPPRRLVNKCRSSTANRQKTRGPPRPRLRTVRSREFF